MHQGVRGTDLAESTTNAVAEPRVRRRRIRVTVIALTVVVGLALGGGAAYAQWDSRQTQLVTDARATLAAAEEAASTARTAGDAALAASDGRVGADDTTRSDLAQLLSADTSVPADGTDGGDRARQAEAIEAEALRLSQWADEVEGAAAAVSAAQAKWELEQAQTAYEQASAELSAAMQAAQEVQSGSEGKVADNTVREALASAIQAGSAITPLDRAAATADELNAGAAGIRSVTPDLAVATEAVSAAQTTWQAEQDKRDAEERERQQRAQQQSAARPTPSAKTPAQPAPKKASSPKKAPSRAPSAPASGGGHRTEESTELYDETICMDTVGNSWTC